MEEINTSQPSSTESNSATEESRGSESLADKLNQPLTRRSFLKGLGMAIAAGTLASCAPKSMLEASSEKENFNENIRELNRQFDLEKDNFLRGDGFFNYERFIQQYPGFENYKDLIEGSSIDMSRRYGVHPNAMRALASSIVASNLNNQDPIKTGDQFHQRVGVMQFYPIHLFEISAIKDSADFPSSTTKLAEPEANIKYGLQYLIEGLREIKNDGENTNIIQLMLAQYYGKDALLDQVKHNREITSESFLWDNYVKYENTLRVLGISLEGNKNSEDLSMEKIWNTAVENWSNTRLSQNKDVFLKEAMRYFNDENNQRLGLSVEQYLALFIAIALTESNGGNDLVNEDSGALGWYQLIPKWKHLEDFNSLHGTNYTYEQIVQNDAVSIEVGIWALMRYKDHMDIKQLLQMFKGGNRFGEYPDDYKWWNSVSEKVKFLLGEDVLALGKY